jgi:flagellar biosynthesis protein FlhF
MQFKKYQAANMRAALEAIKQDLGADAMIVATRQLDGGLFKKPRLEVTATAPPPAPPVAAAAPAAPVDTFAATAGAGAMPAAARYGLREVDEATDTHGTVNRSGALRQPTEEQSSGQAVLQEIAGLRSMLSNLSLRGGGAALPDALADVLAAADVDPSLALELVSAARARAERNVGDDAVPLMRDELVALKQIIAAELPVDTSFFTDRSPKRIALIGPTGVGKTTTLAKIAAHAALVHHRRVALISLDTYRIAAFEQLRQYASLMDVPVTLARDPASFAAAVEAYRDVDLLLIDTAGRGTADKSHHSALCEMFSAHQVQTYLVLSATTRRMELRSIVRAFAALDPQAQVFTKLDETLALGALLNASRACGVPITFVTHGQRVPEDIGLPDANELASRLVHAVLDGTRPRKAARATAARSAGAFPSTHPAVGHVHAQAAAWGI